jgi:hypothetical protein
MSKNLMQKRDFKKASLTSFPSFAAAKVQHFRKPAKLYTTFFENNLKIYKSYTLYYILLTEVSEVDGVREVIASLVHSDRS